MIRMNPAHDTVNPPGCVQPAQQENVRHQEKPLEKEIDDYLEGYEAGYRDAMYSIYPNAARWTSEFDR